MFLCGINVAKPTNIFTLLSRLGMLKIEAGCYFCNGIRDSRLPDGLGLICLGSESPVGCSALVCILQVLTFVRVISRYLKFICQNTNGNRNIPAI